MKVNGIDKARKNWRKVATATTAIVRNSYIMIALHMSQQIVYRKRRVDFSFFFFLSPTFIYSLFYFISSTCIFIFILILNSLYMCVYISTFRLTRNTNKIYFVYTSCFDSCRVLGPFTQK